MTEISHVKGSDNVVADALSRYPRSQIMESVWSSGRTLMSVTISGFGATLLPHGSYKLTKNFLLGMLRRPSVSPIVPITNQTYLGLRPPVHTLCPSLVALVLFRFFDVNLGTWRLPSSILCGTLLQPLLQSLQHQRRLMLRKTLPCLFYGSGASSTRPL